MNEFKITNKHYQILLKQGADNLPYETGGFLGGKNGTITGILPTFNKDWDENTDVYKIDNEDFRRAHEFFQKNNLEYYGVYHTHPKGSAYPSEADINTGHRYHFIISYMDPNNPDFKVYRIDNKKPILLPFTVLSDSGFMSTKEKKIKNQILANEAKNQSDLNNRISNILDNKPNTYEKMPPQEGNLNSDFSTLA